MLSINFNPSMLGIQNKLNTSNNILNTSLQRLSTGMRINSVSDDVAGYYESQGLNSQIKGLKEAQNNITMGSSFLSTAEDTMNNMTDMLNRLNDLALQGASTTLSDTERSALTKEANALVEEIKKQNKETTFNGTNIFGSVSETYETTNISSNTVPSGYTAVYTAEDLNNVRNNLSGNYILMADIDLSSVENWEPIGTSSIGNEFTGVFDGNGHVIKNLTINRPDTSYVGLFGYAAGGTIQNIGLENVNVTGNNFTGGLVGMVSGCDLTISNSYVTGSVTGNNSTGGLVGGVLASTVSNSYATGTVTGNNMTGGLVGNAFDLTVSNSYSNCDVKMTDGTTGTKFGVLFGHVSSASLPNSTSAATNVYGNIDKSTIKTMIGNGTFSSSSNIRIMSESEFTTHSTWDCFDNSVWEMSCSIPPVLKGVGTNNINWYFGRGNNENLLQIGEGSDSSANSMTINTGLDLGAIKIDFSTVESCLDASRCAQAAIDAIAKRTTAIGITQNRLENAAEVNSTKIENLTSAHSGITDADVAEETANYTKAQIMTQTANSLLAQTQYFQSNLLINMINSL